MRWRTDGDPCADPLSRDRASQVTVSWVFLGEVADHKLSWERLPTSPGLCGEASPDPLESWKFLHPWLLWLPPSLSVCLPLLTGSSPRAGHLFSSCISSATNCNERALWLILSLRLLLTRPLECLELPLVPVLFCCPPSLRLLWTQVLLRAATLVFLFPPEAPSPSLHPDTHPPSWFSVGTQERGWMGVGLARSGLVSDFSHSGQHFLHHTPRPPGQSAQASSSINTRSRCWFVEDTGWLPPA